jgi:oligopeptide/dipeptide ABC transporter ATP-binding protein
MSPLLEIDRLTVQLPVEGELRTVLSDVSLAIGEGQSVGLVGESGSGKTMTARAVARLLPAGAQVSGSIRFDGADVLTADGRRLRSLRERVAVVFQDPRAHVNPVRRIGDFMTEVLRINHGMAKREARRRAVAMLDEVGVSRAERRLDQYPHELSGGLLQRVMIAAALLVEPRLLLADEPTTALDVTTQAEVMGLLDELRRERGLAMLFITHDLDLAGAVCDRTVVMYAGQVMEEQASTSLHSRPRHPYTTALIGARPDITATATRLTAIPGRPLSAFEAPAGCAFASRCEHVEEQCTVARPELAEVGGDVVRCVRAEELHGVLAEATASVTAHG